MKLSLVVNSPGKSQGKVIPITLSQFLIGRDPQCHLRPASPLISNRHCALLVRNGKVFLRDFDSTNGSFINEEQIKGEKEIQNDDQLKVGPITFAVRLEVGVPVNKPTPIPQTSASAAKVAKKVAEDAQDAQAEDDESAAHMLLSLEDDGPTPAGPVGEDGVPQGSTVFELPGPGAQEGPAPPGAKPDAAKKDAKKPSGNTSTAAKAILEKYTRRQRNP
jgi:pSer/pThr/pTyr-binding forkhead associated (FHA) protein